MTTVEFVPSDIFGYEGFRISGHSGYADAGEDIVCAYISSAAELTLTLLCDMYEVENELEISQKNADVRCTVVDTPENREKASDIRKIMSAFYAHIGELRKQFPKNVKISERKILL